VEKAAEILVLSDPHYASSAERVRVDFEIAGLTNPVSRLLLKLWRRLIWLRDPFAHNYLLDQLLERAGEPDIVVANGDFSCDSGFIGLADSAARQSAEECLAKMRARFGERLRTTMGDHEFGKTSLAGGRGGLRLESWRVATEELLISPAWEYRIHDFVMVGVTSSLIALDAFRPEILPEEWADWNQLRTQHLDQIRQVFDRINSHERILLFCHDPTALPFLGQEEFFRRKFCQLNRTIIGHLHTPMVLWQARVLSGCPPIPYFGKGIHRITRALNRARAWRPFKVLLCPSLSGSQLLKDGGYYTVRLRGGEKPEFTRHRLKWR
jgi:hypothetical protein